jgi:two-component sensor histidine kinase
MDRTNHFPFEGLAVCFFMSFALALAGCSAPKPDSVQAAGGVLDLRKHDFSKGGGVPLTGLWDFLPGSVDSTLGAFMESNPRLRRVPDLWKGEEAGGQKGHGSGTYHLTVLLPPNAPPMALHYLSASTAFRIEVQGSTLVQVGVPSTDPALARAAYKPGFVRLGPVGERMEIMIRVSNYTYRTGGLWFPIFLGSAEAIESIHITEMAITIVQCMALAVMGFLLLLLFYLRRKDRAFLYAGLLALTLAIRVLVTGEYLVTRVWPDIPFALMIKLEYLTFALAVFAGTAFFTSLFPLLMSRRMKWACLVPSPAYAVLIIVLPLDLMTRSLIFYQGFVFLNIAVLGVAVFRKTVLKSSAEGIALFIGAMILAASAVNDIFYSFFVWWTGNLAPWGFLVFVGIQVVIMVNRMTTAFAGVEKLLAQKELLIKEIHHRVKNSLQVVSSLISLQSNRIEDPAVKDIFSMLKRRIISMSLVHEKLYGKMASDSLDLGDYLDDLIRLLVSKDSLESAKVSLTVVTRSVETDGDSCFDVGLIVTELVSNAMKYALLPKGGGSLRVETAGKEDMLEIVVEDDGPGFPPGFDFESADGLGYKLILGFIKSRRGNIEMLPGPGGRVRVALRLGAD